MKLGGVSNNLESLPRLLQPAILSNRRARDRFKPDGNNEVITLPRRRSLEKIFHGFSWRNLGRQFRISHLSFPLSCLSSSNIYLLLYPFSFPLLPYFTLLSSFSNVCLLLQFHLSLSNICSTSSSLSSLPSFPFFTSFFSPHFPPFTFPLYSLPSFLSFFLFSHNFLSIYIYIYTCLRFRWRVEIGL